MGIGIAAIRNSRKRGSNGHGPENGRDNSDYWVVASKYVEQRDTLTATSTAETETIAFSHI